ncbi:hypothetical protein [Hymenobacter sp. B1770]|uniref:hypothetical protein n=1 Tax=Hymenobacter sp. B1770 TaxID=1718788 RepID=UPI003CEE0811
MKKLILFLLFLLSNNICFSQDANYLGFVRPDTGYNDFHDTNFNSYWGKKEEAITNQILLTKNFKKVVDEFKHSTHIIVYENLKLHNTSINLYFNDKNGLERIAVSRYYGDLPQEKLDHLILPMMTGFTPDSEGVYRDKKKNVTSWRTQNESEGSFTDIYIPYTTLRLN